MYLSEDYNLRKCFFRQEQVPSISTIIKKMTPPLAAVYFKSMKPRIKVIAGLEPSLKGGGNDWFQPPQELLAGRAVLKPVKKAVLSQLNYQGIGERGAYLFQNHRKDMSSQIRRTLYESDINWKNTVTATTYQLWEKLVEAAIEKNSKQIMNDFDCFAYLYRQSIGKIEILFHESAVAEIRNTRERTKQVMKQKYETSLKQQATLLYDEYEKKLVDEQARLKDQFVQKSTERHKVMANNVHDLNVDKYMAIEKIKQCLQSQNLACQIYVALKEQEECLKETGELKYEHKKTMKVMQDTILTKEMEINLAAMREKKRKEFCTIWQKKACLVVKSFQTFVLYCLHMLPDYAEFFINMEKLMLLQLNETLKDPSAASIFEQEKEQFTTPVPQTKPFYIICDKGYKPKLDQKLCPKPSGHSTTSDVPVMIVNKQCLYAACDNFTLLTDKVTEFIYGNRGNDADMRDDLSYEHFKPVKYDSAQQLLEIKLEDSLLQVLQQEMPYIQTDKKKTPRKCSCGSSVCRCPDKEYEPILCSRCGLQWCSCPNVSIGEINKIQASKVSMVLNTPQIGRRMELCHEREPCWDSYCRHVEPTKCTCAKTAKKHLKEHLPSYMRHLNMNYGPPDLPGYEICSVNTLKALVRATKQVPMPKDKVAPKTKDMGTQYDDIEFEALCTCFSESELTAWLMGQKIDDLALVDTGKEASGVPPPTLLPERKSSFATSRAYSLRNLIEDLPDLKEIFFRKDCTFED